MGLIDWLDKMTMGEEFINRCKNQRENSGFKSAEEISKEEYINGKEQEKMFQKKMDKYSNGHLFNLNQVPEFIKDKMIFWDSNLKSCWNKDYFKQNRRHELYLTFHDGWFPDIAAIFNTSIAPRNVIPHYKISVGIEYVENEQGESALRVFKKKKESY